MTAVAQTVMGSIFGQGGTDPWAGLRTVTAGGGGGAQPSSLLSALQGGATLFSVFADLQGRRAEASSMRAAANDAETEADLERLSGLERRVSLKAEAEARLGEATAAFAASGADLSFGQPQQVARGTFRELDLALSASQTTEDTRVARLRERAETYRSRARATRNAGRIEAAGSLMSLGADLARRG
jgi:hypothetical protein